MRTVHMASHTEDVVPREENLYRRFPLDWWSSPKNKNKPIPASFFMPRPWKSEKLPGDTDGLSVSLASKSTIKIASTSSCTGRRLCLARFPARIAMDRGLSVVPQPTNDDLGHAVIPELNSTARRDPNKEKIIEEHAIALRDAATVVWPRDS